MMKQNKITRSFVLVIPFLFLMVDTVSAGTCGGAVQCNCGDTLIESQTMWYDLMDCPGDGLIIGADSITLDCNGHVIDGSAGGDAGIRLDGKSYVTIKNCNVREFYTGIYLYSSSNNVLTSNTAYDNSSYGIELVYESNNNVLSDNTIDNNHQGLGIVLVGSSYNNLSGNIANNNYPDGIRLRISSHNTLFGNTANNNLNGIHLWSGSNNTLSGNTASNNGEGIILELSSYNNLLGNIANSNNHNGISLLHYGSDYNVLSGNVAKKNGYDGLYLSASFNNNISSNELIENNRFGVYLYYSQYNTFWNNTFTDNAVNACEDPNSNNNTWNLSDLGNYWADFPSNPGFPHYYEISGRGDGVDYHPIWTYICGDLNLDGNINLPDVIYLANFLLKSGPVPKCDPIKVCADADGDGYVTLADVIYLANYLLKGGPEPVCS